MSMRRLSVAALTVPLLAVAACGSDSAAPAGSSEGAGGSDAAGASGSGTAGGSAGTGTAGTTTAGTGGTGTAGAAGTGTAGTGTAGTGTAGSTAGLPFDTSKGATVDPALAAMVTGTYAVKVRIAVKQEVPILGKTDSASTAYGLATLEVDGSGLVAKEQGCHVDVDPSPSATTTIPDAVPQSVPPTTVPFHLWMDGSSVQFVRMPVAIAVGVKLTDPEKDALPTSGTDPRVWDQDKDGNPGITVSVKGLAAGDIYAVQKQKSAYYGTFASGTFTGLVWDDSVQQTIGASTPLLNQNVKSVQDPDAKKSPMVMVKVDAATDCKKLLADKAKLFP